MCRDMCPCTRKCEGLIDRIGMYTRTAQQLELKAASLREQAQKLQERINRGER